MNRAHTILAAVTALTLALAAGTAIASEASGEHGDAGEITVRGEILDMACYVAHEAKGPDHASCAKRCVKGGQPMGLLAEDGTVYLLYASHSDASAFEAAKDLAGEKVELTGASATQAGIHGIEVHAVRAL